MPTYTVRQSGGDYSTLAAALAGVSSGDTISIEGSWTADDTSAVTINKDITIQVTGDSQHPGYWDETQNHYRLVVSSGSHCLTLNGAYSATLDGLAVEQATTSDNSAECFRCVPGTSDAVTIKNCLIWSSQAAGASTANQDGVYLGYHTSIGTVTFENCIIIGAKRGGIEMQNNYNTSGNSGTVNVNSCTLWNNGRYSGTGDGDTGGGVAFGTAGSGNNSNFTVNVHNTISIENVTTSAHDDYRDSATSVFRATWNISYSVDSDNSIAGVDGSGSGNLASRTATDNTSPGAGDWIIFEDVTSSPYDLRLVDNAENDAQDAHAVATAESLTIPGTDIVGTSRPQNTNYDIGAFEISSGAPPSVVIPIIMAHRRNHGQS